MRRQIGLHRGRHRLDIGGRLLGQADEKQPGDAAHMHRFEAMATRVEVAPHMLGEQEPAVLGIGPLVIAADDVANGRLLVIDEAGAAMTADIVKGADLHVFAADEQHRSRPDIDGHAIAGLRHVGLDADIDPMPAEYQAEIEVEDLAAEIEWCFQRVTRLAAPDQFFSGNGQRHWLVLLEKTVSTTNCAAFQLTGFPDCDRFGAMSDRSDGSRPARASLIKRFSIR